MERISNAHFPIANENPTATAAIRRIQRYNADLDILLRILICVMYFGKSDADGLLARSFGRIAEENGPEGGMTAWVNMKRYPAVRLLYALGLASIAADKYQTLKRLFDLKIKRAREDNQEFKVISRINDHAVIERRHQSQLLERKEHTPLSNHLFETLRDPLRDYLPSDAAYDEAFTWLEYLMCLCSLDATLSSSDAKAFAAGKTDICDYWVPIGRFAWNRSSIKEETVISEDEQPDKVAAVLRAGFFDSGGKVNPNKFIALKTLVDRLTITFRHDWRLFW